MVRRDKSNYIIQSVAHALDVLEEFRDETEELGVTELSKKLKLHKNNVFRILATLQSRNYIEQNRANDNYRLGVKCLELGQTFIHQRGLLKQARPILQELAETTGETSYISILRGNEVVYLDAVETSSTVRVISRVGLHMPLHATAAGRPWSPTTPTTSCGNCSPEKFPASRRPPGWTSTISSRRSRSSGSAATPSISRNSRRGCAASAPPCATTPAR